MIPNVNYHAKFHNFHSMNIIYTLDTSHNSLQYVPKSNMAATKILCTTLSYRHKEIYIIKRHLTQYSVCL